MNLSIGVNVFGCVEDDLLKRPRGEVLVEFVGVINQNIRDVQLEIRKSVDENTGDCYYVLVGFSLHSSSQSCRNLCKMNWFLACCRNVTLLLSLPSSSSSAAASSSLGMDRY